MKTKEKAPFNADSIKGITNNSKIAAPFMKLMGNQDEWNSLEEIVKTSNGGELPEGWDKEVYHSGLYESKLAEWSAKELADRITKDNEIKKREQFISDIADYNVTISDGNANIDFILQNCSRALFVETLSCIAVEQGIEIPQEVFEYFTELN